jgi:hypothetical protein
MNFFLGRGDLPTIKIDLDINSFRRLSELAVKERRPIAWQAEVLLIRVLEVPAESRVKGGELQPQEVACAAE